METIHGVGHDCATIPRYRHFYDNFPGSDDVSRKPMVGTVKMSTGNAQIKTPEAVEESFADELDPGTPLMHGQYRIAHFLNAGGFGITYTALDSLDRKVVIKECFPCAFCRRSQQLVSPRSRAHKGELSNIIRLFVQEAKNLARLEHPNIVGVHQVFEDNNTAYMALDYVQGRDLLEIIEDPDQTLDPEIIQDMLAQLLDAVGYIHSQNVLHRDISPDNILINSLDVPILIDFGAAREQASQGNRAMSALRVVKDGYSPQEFYVAGAEQSPSSDLYALAASFYHLISGDLAPDSQTRLSAAAAGEPDPYMPLAGHVRGYPNRFLEALDKAMAVLPKDRMNSAQEWLEYVRESGNCDVQDEPKQVQKRPDWKKPALLLGATATVTLTIGAFLLSPALSVAPDQPEFAGVAPDAPLVVAENDPDLTGPSQDVPVRNDKSRPNRTASAAQLNTVELAALDGFDVPFVAKIPSIKTKVPALTSAELIRSQSFDLLIEKTDPTTGQVNRVFAIGGTKVSSQSELDAVLAGKATPISGQTFQISVLSGPTVQTATHNLRTVRVVDQLILPNGLVIHTYETASGWESQVATIPAGLDVALAPGDVLIGDLKSNALLADAGALDRAFSDGLRGGITRFAFAVKRGSKTWAAEIDLGTESKTTD